MKLGIIVIFLLFFNVGIKIQAQDKELINRVVDTTTAACLVHDTTVLVNVEVDAKFHGGDLQKFRNYVMMNIHYPIEANMNKYQGKAYISFVVDWDGQVRRVLYIKVQAIRY